MVRISLSRDETSQQNRSMTAWIVEMSEMLICMACITVVKSHLVCIALHR